MTTLCVCLPLTALAAPSDVEARLRLPLKDLSFNGGYFPLVVELANRGDKKHRIEVEADNGSGRVYVPLRVDLGPRESATLEIPLFARHNTRIRVASDRDGRILEESVSTSCTESNNLLIVAEREPDRRGLNARLGGIATAPSGHRAPTPPKAWTCVHLPPREMPGKWQSLSGVDLIVTDAPALARMDATRREALTGYLEMGGNLLVYNAGAAAGGRIEDLLPGLLLEPGRSRGEYGLGRAALTLDDPFGPDASPWTPVFASLCSESGRDRSLRRMGIHADEDSYPVYYGRRHAARAGPKIPGLGTIPVKSLTFLMFLFAVAVGPANFFLLNRMKRRALAIVTIPALSAAAVALLVAWAFLSEGFSVKVVPRTLTWIDQRTRRACSFARLGYYANLVPAGGLRFDAQALAFPTSPEDGWTATLRGVDWTDGLRLVGDWLAPRTPTELVTLSARPCRQRIQTGAENADGLSVNNGLEADLKVLFVRTRKGLYQVENLAAGSTATARPAGAISAEHELARRVPEDLWQSFPNVPVRRRLAPDLPAGAYEGLTDRAVLADYGVKNPEILPGVHIIRGRLEEGN